MSRKNGLGRCGSREPLRGGIVTDSEVLRRENAIVLSAVQALLGLISANVVAVSVNIEADRVELSFWVRVHTSEVEEDAEQAIFWMEVFYDEDRPLFEYKIRVGAPDPNVLSSYGRMIYWAVQ